MYLHIVPQLFHLMVNKCHLESITIPELNFRIEGDALSTGRPHPNKNIWVGMRKGRKAIVGLLVILLKKGNDTNLLIVFYIQIMPDDFVM